MKSKHRQRSQIDPTALVAIAPSASGDWIAVAVGVGASGVQYHDSSTFPAQGQALSTWISERSLASRVVVVLPEGCVVARTVTMPDASKESLEMALRLQMENFILGGSARHRNAAALLPTPFGQNRCALMLEWPESSPAPALPSGLDQSCSYTAPIAAVAALACAARGNSERGIGVLSLSQRDGAISIGMVSRERALLRTVHEAGEETQSWQKGLRTALNETTVFGEFDQSIGEGLLQQSMTIASGLVASGDVSGALPSAPQDPDWWREYGVAAGAALAALGSLRPLTTLQPKQVTARGGLVSRALGRLSESGVAARLAIAALILLAVAPPAFAWMRREILLTKVDDPAAYRALLTQSQRQLSMYKDLGKVSWPMTKLLGDIACNVPEGIELQSVLLLHGERVTLRGVARSQGGVGGTDSILEMEHQLLSSKVFDRVEKSWDPPDGKGVYKFTMSAAVSSPLTIHSYPEAQDFGLKTLRDRRYGPDPAAAVVAPPPAVLADSGSESSGGTDDESASDDATQPRNASGDSTEYRSTTRRDTSGSVPGDLARRGRTPSTATPTSIVPDPLTDAQIAAMTQSEAREMLAKIATARNAKGLDEAVKKRLREEWDKLFEQAKKP